MSSPAELRKHFDIVAVVEIIGLGLQRRRSAEARRHGKGRRETTERRSSAAHVDWFGG